MYKGQIIGKSKLDNNPTKEYVEQFLQPKIMYQVFKQNLVKPRLYDEQGFLY